MQINDDLIIKFDASIEIKYFKNNLLLCLSVTIFTKEQLLVACSLIMNEIVNGLFD